MRETPGRPTRCVLCLVFGIALPLALSIACLPAARAATERGDATESHAWAIRNVRIFDGSKVVPNGTVAISGGVITAAGPEVEIEEGTEVIDGIGKTLLPGLIDAHTHALGDALHRALRFGVTTELDMFTAVDFLRQAKEQQSAQQAAGRADLFSAGTLITVPGGHGTEYFAIPTLGSLSEAQAFVDRRIAEGSDYIKIVYEDGRAYGLSFPCLDKPTLAAVVDAAHRRGKLAVVHISSREAAREALEAGADGLAHVFADQPADRALIQMATRGRRFVIPTLTLIESVAGGPGGTALLEDEALKPFISSEEKARLAAPFPRTGRTMMNVAMAREATRQLKSAGVSILAGTDAGNPGTAHGLSLHRELELLVSAGLTPVEALAAATSIPAEVFGFKDRGRIAPGLRADLVLVSGDPTVDIRRTRAIAGIWKQGESVPREPQAAASPTPRPQLPADGLVSDFDAGEPLSTFGFGWQESTDSLTGGKSTATLRVVDRGARETKGCLDIRGELVAGYAFPWAGAIFFPGPGPMQPADLSPRKELVFWARGDGHLRVMVFAGALGPIPSEKSVAIGAQWTEYVLALSEFGGFNGRDLKAVLFSGGPEPGPFGFQIDEVRFR